MATKPDLNPEPVRSAAEINARESSSKAATPIAPPATYDKAATDMWPGAFNTIGPIFAQMKKNPQPAYVFIGVYVTLALLGQMSTGSSSPMDSNQSTAGPESLVSLIFLLALPIYALALADRKPITVNQFMDFNLRRYFTILGVTLLTIVIVFFAALPLLIPLIWVVPWVAMATYAVVDKKLGVIDALKESKRIGQDNKGKVWGVVGVTIVLTVAAALFSFIPLIGAAVAAVASLVSAGVMASLYRWLQKYVPANV